MKKEKKGVYSSKERNLEGVILVTAQGGREELCGEGVPRSVGLLWLHCRNQEGEYVKNGCHGGGKPDVIFPGDHFLDKANTRESVKFLKEDIVGEKGSSCA